MLPLLNILYYDTTIAAIQHDSSDKDPSTSVYYLICNSLNVGKIFESKRVVN